MNRILSRLILVGCVLFNTDSPVRFKQFIDLSIQADDLACFSSQALSSSVVFMQQIYQRKVLKIRSNRNLNKRLNQMRLKNHLEKCYGIQIKSLEQLTGSIGTFVSKTSMWRVNAQEGKFVFRCLFAKNETGRERALYVIKFMKHLYRKGIPVAELTPQTGLIENSTEPETFLNEYEDGYFCLEKWLDSGEFTHRKDAKPAHYIALGKLAAKIAVAAQDFQPTFKPTWKTRREIVESCAPNRLILLKEELIHKQQQNLQVNKGEQFFLNHADEIIQLIQLHRNEFLRTYHTEVLSHRHNDLKFGNVQFDDEGHVTGVIDFDRAEYGDTFVEFNNLILGADSLTDIPVFRIEDMHASIEGYHSVRYLSTEEQVQIVEVLRSRLIENIFNRLFSGSIFDVRIHPDQWPRLQKDLENLRIFPYQIDFKVDGLLGKHVIDCAA